MPTDRGVCVCVCVEGAFWVQYLPFLSALRKICNEKRGKKEGCQKRFHIIKVKVSVCVCVCVCVCIGIIDHTLKSSVSLNY